MYRLREYSFVFGQPFVVSFSEPCSPPLGRYLVLFFVAVFLISGALASASDEPPMDFVKLPKFRGERRVFEVWKKLFRAFGLMQKWAPALPSGGAAFSQQQVDM
jgi:hypothetical protein